MVPSCLKGQQGKQKDKNKGQKSFMQTNTKQLVDNNNFLNKGEFGLAPKRLGLIEKAEKLTIATYMVASFIPEENPIKDKIFNISVDLLSDIHSLSSQYHKTMRTVDELLSFLSIATAVNLISSMNHSILKREYQNLKNIFEIEGIGQKTHDISLTLLETYFDPQEIKKSKSDTNSIPILNRTDRDYKGHDVIKDKRTKEMSVRKEVKGTQNFDATKTGTYQDANVQKSKRQQEIIQIVASQKSVNIKDISAIILDCSSKTIQRELLVLVGLGVLKKEGEKRWSRYSLT